MPALIIRSGIDSLIAGKLVKSSMPDYSDLIVWKEEGIDSIVNLLEECYRDVAIDEERTGFKVLHSPVPDFRAPGLEQLHKIVLWIDSEIVSGRRVLVHCYAGIGRTGTVLIAYLIYKGYDMTTASEEVYKTGAAPQSFEQREIIDRYYDYIHK